MENKLIILSGEADMIVSHLLSFWYIEVAKEALETSFQALDTFNVVSVGERNSANKRNLTITSLKSENLMVEMGRSEGWW